MEDARCTQQETSRKSGALPRGSGLHSDMNILNICNPHRVHNSLSKLAASINSCSFLASLSVLTVEINLFRQSFHPDDTSTPASVCNIVVGQRSIDYNKKMQKTASLVGLYSALAVIRVSNCTRPLQTVEYRTVQSLLTILFVQLCTVTVF